MNAKFNSISEGVTLLAYRARYFLFIISLLLFSLYSQLDGIIIQNTSSFLVTMASPFVGPVEKIEGKLKINRGKPFSVLQTQVNIKKDSFYLVIVDHDSEGGFLLDFFRDSGYDNPEQERYVPAQPGRSVFRIFSGNPSGNAPIFFRIHFDGDHDVILNDIIVVETPAWYRYRDFLLFGAFAFLLLSISLMLRERSSKEALFLFSITLLVYVLVASVPATGQGGDNMWYFPVTDSLLRDGTVTLDHFEERIREVGAAHIISTPLGPVNYLPLGPSLLGIPFLFFGQLLGQNLHSTAEFAAKFLAAGTAAIIYLIALELGLRRRYAVLLTLILAFATTHFPIHAGGYWSHNCSSFLASLLLLTTLRLFDKKMVSYSNRLQGRYLFLVAIIIVFGYMCRPDFSLLVISLGFFLLSRFFYGTVMAGLYSLLLLGVFIIWSLGVYGSWLPPYFSPNRIDMLHFDIMIKQLFSPNRGLFVFNPVFLLCIFSLYYVVSKHDNRFFFITIIIYIILSLAAVSGYGHWWAGHSFGPRIYASLFPVMTVLLIPFLLWTQNWPARWKSSSLILVTLAGLFINAPAAFDNSGDRWNVTPKNVDAYPERVSDWTDMQFLRFYRNLVSH
jgi:hypothetical protein